MTRLHAISRPARVLATRVDLATDGICISIEGDDCGKVERLARRVKAVMAEHQAAEALQQHARGG